MIDGVPVFRVDGPAPLAAVLVFRVGIRDEPFARRGVTHMVEHLAMSRLGRRRHDHNASVSTAVTTFEAAGPPEAVAAFLADVCAALADLPVDRLETERKVVAVEAQGGAGPMEWDRLLRYGLRGPGLAAADPPAPDALDAEAVRAWAARHFVRANAALALTGPPPPGLRLPLPDGPVPPRPPVPPLPLGGPVWSDHPGPLGVTLSVRTPATEAASVAARVAQERLTDRLRHELGLVYDVHVDLAVDVSDGTGCLTVLADPPARSAVRVAEVLDEVLRGLAADGPTEAELAEDLAEWRAVDEDPRIALEAATAAAMEHLHGDPDWDPAKHRAEREAVGAGDVRAALADYPATAILSVPEGVEPALPGFSRYPEHLDTPVTGRTFPRRLLGPVPRGAHLVVGDEGVSLVLRDGAATVRWDDVIGYGEGPDQLRTLYGGDGCMIDLHPAFFRSGQDAVALVEARVPADVRFPQPAEDPA